MSIVVRIPKPRTAAQRAAARANGAKSHGPVTDDGKAKSALNALCHGLTAATLVLTTEDKARFDELFNAYIDEYQPATQTERDLVQEITASKWLQRRCWALQTALLDVTMDRMEEEIAGEFSGIPHSTRTALAFAKEANKDGALALLNRYAGRHAREWHRAVDKLRAIQKERVPNEPGPAVLPMPAARNSEGEQPDSTISPNEPEPILTPMTSSISTPAPPPVPQPRSPNSPAGSNVLIP